jgi:hypothetical protein
MMNKSKYLLQGLSIKYTDIVGYVIPKYISELAYKYFVMLSVIQNEKKKYKDNEILHAIWLSPIHQTAFNTDFRMFQC